MYIIKNAKVYTPSYAGIKDILICGGKIEAVSDNIELSGSAEIKVIDASKLLAVPGLIDNHVHITGGGGEGGFASRTPELMLTQLTSAGVTTVVGCLGTDGTARSLGALVAKANGLTAEGVTAYAMTGSYAVPPITLTGSTQSDIMYIDAFIGAGEIAISDHRSSQPTFDELTRVISEARIGGMLSGKGGVTVLHVGDGKRGLEYLRRILKETELPACSMLPTHIDRSEALFAQGVEYALAGGYIDLTSSADPDFPEEDEVMAWDALKRALDAGVAPDHITMSSDGQGSMPIFDGQRNMIGMGVGQVESLHFSIVKAVKELGVSLEHALMTVTSNPASLFKLSGKGAIRTGFDADITLLDEDTLSVNTVFARGKLMVDKGECVVKGTFER